MVFHNYLKIVFFILIAGSISGQPPAKPNIIVILIDDMGWQDCSVPFYKEKTWQNDLFNTPNLEAMAAQGVKCTHAYANQNCTPSRVSMMTGMNVINHHVTSWTKNKNKNSEPDALGLIQPRWNMNGLSPIAGYENAVYATTLPQVLRQHGYRTIHVGKAHFGAYETPGADPLKLGFDVNVSGSSIGHPGSYYGTERYGHHKKDAYYGVNGLERYWDKDIFLTEAHTQIAIEEMEKCRQKGDTFFMHLSHYAIHTPIMADHRFVQKYYDMGIDSTEAKYASLVEGMDKSVGDIIAYLKEKNIDNNTLVIFLSDNGALSDVARDKTKINTYCAPLRSGKTSGYEGGIRIPMIIKWPGKIDKNTVFSQNVMVEDMFKTICSAAGVSKISTVQKIDGIDILECVRNGKRMHDRILTWHYPHSHSGRHKDISPYSTIRMGAWKLMYFHLDSHFELYNTEKDISESNNLASQDKKRVKKMAAKLSGLLKKSKAPMPYLADTNKQVIYPDEAFQIKY